MTRRMPNHGTCHGQQCGACLGCSIRRAWAEGRFAHRRQGRRGDFWTPEQDAQLRAVVGTVPTEQLVQTWRERTGVDRSLEALRTRCKRIGVSSWVKSWSLRDLEALLGVNHRTIIEYYVETGELHGTRWHGRGPNLGWWFEERDIEQFLRAYPWRYDWTRMRPGHRLTVVAEMVHRADPWRPHEELARYCGIHLSALRKWRLRGLVPIKRQPKAGGHGRCMVRGRDFASIKAAIDAERTASNQRARLARRGVAAASAARSRE